MKFFLSFILSFSRLTKRCIVIFTDTLLCILSFWVAYFLKLDKSVSIIDINIYSIILSLSILIPINFLFGLYRTIFRYTGISIITNVLVAILIYEILFSSIVLLYGLKGMTLSISFIQSMLLFFFIMFSRLAAKSLFLTYLSHPKNSNKSNILVYGAGSYGRQLVNSLENSPEFKVVGFLDDNVQLHSQIILGKNVYSFFEIEKLLKNNKISYVFLAIPSITRSLRKQIIEKLNNYKLNVKTLPSISEIVEGNITISDIKDLNIDDLLDRDEVKPDIELLNKNINKKTVLVTGAGGSIGSELSRQIIKLKPTRLVLFELNEFNLYKISEELKNINNVKVIPLLGNSQDQKKLELVFETFKVDTVYHAAAYKHVPLVEENICEGVLNNVFSTLAVAKASILKKVSNLVLISSDKAVRPTNVMGASKRLCELCMQGIYMDNKNISISFSIVRFGNVLESSGSVIPKFKSQIKQGGPITLSHNDVSRYFMTVSEAAQLVIQSGAMSKKCEVYVLDMGKSIKIKEIILKMINLSGLRVKDQMTPKGDIEIKIVGLRPGEKLYEELLIGDNPEKTKHPKIMKTNDPFIPYDILSKDLIILKNLLDDEDSKGVKIFLNKLLKSYNPAFEITDHLYNERN